MLCNVIKIKLNIYSCDTNQFEYDTNVLQIGSSTPLFGVLGRGGTGVGISNTGSKPSRPKRSGGSNIGVEITNDPNPFGPTVLEYEQVEEEEDFFF